MSTYPLKVIGDCQFELKRPQEGAGHLHRARAAHRKQEDNDDLAGALFDVGSMQIVLGKLAEARQNLLEAKQSNEAWAKELASDPATTADERDGNAVDQGEILFHLAVVSAQRTRRPRPAASSKPRSRPS